MINMLLEQFEFIRKWVY